MSLAAIQQAARELAGHADSINAALVTGEYGRIDKPNKDARVVAERLVQLAADVAATHEKIRVEAKEIADHGECVRCETGAQAILGLLEPSEHTPARDYPANPYDDGVDLYEDSPDA